MSLLIRYLVIVLSILLAEHVVPGIAIEDFPSALLAGLVLGVFNLVVRPILLVLTLPVTLITLGLFIFIINTVLFWGAALIVPGFSVPGFLPAFLGALIVSAVSLVSGKLLK